MVWVGAAELVFIMAVPLTVSIRTQTREVSKLLFPGDPFQEVDKVLASILRYSTQADRADWDRNLRLSHGIRADLIKLRDLAEKRVQNAEKVVQLSLSAGGKAMPAELQNNVGFAGDNDADANARWPVEDAKALCDAIDVFIGPPDERDSSTPGVTKLFWDFNKNRLRVPSLPVSNGWVSSLKRKGGNYSSYFTESGLRLTTVHTAILCHVICYRAPDTFTPTYLIDAMQEAAEEIKKYVQVRLLEEKSRIVELQPSDVSEMHFEMERKIPNEHLGAPQFDVTIKALPAKLSSTKLLHKGERVVGVIAHGNMTVASIPFEEEEFEIGARVLHYTYDDHNGLPCVVTKRDDPPLKTITK